MEWNRPILEMKNIHLHYGTVHALKGVDFNLYRGEIHAIVGTHRAGKSSLVKILTGDVQRDEGDVIINGEAVGRITVKTAFQKKIGMFYQNEEFIHTLSTLDSIFIGHFVGPSKKDKSNRQKEKNVRAFCEKYNIELNLKKSLLENTLNEQYLVEFLNVAMRDPDILILDELSTRFTPEEMENLYPIIFDLKKNGKAIIYITHNMDEIMRMADRVTILKEGLKMGTEEIKDLDTTRLIKLAYSFALSRQELEKENLELYNLKKYNEDVLKNIPIGVVILDDKNDIYFTNEAAYSILKTEKMEASHLQFASFINGKDFTGKDELLANIDRHEYFSLPEVRIQEDILKITTIPFVDEENTFQGTIILIEDITNDLKLMDYLLRAEKVSSIAELAAGVAHEINNPLGIVQNYVDLLMDTKLDEGQLEKLSELEKEILRIAGIVRNLLSFSKSAGLRFNTVDIGTILQEAVVLLDHKLKEKNISVAGNYKTRDIFCEGDENRLKQLFINLIMNSVDAVKEKGKIDISIGKNGDKKAWMISIRDNGSGVPPEVLPNIFDPFFSTKECMNNAGLGLSICQHILDLHGGTLVCESEPGEYTTFYITLPVLHSIPGS